MAGQDRLAGDQSSLTFGGTSIPITKYTPKVNRKLADTTDTGDFDSAAGLIANTQVPVSYNLELSVEGKFRKSVTPSALIAQLFSGATAVPTVLTLAQGVLFGHGNFDLSDFSCEVPAEDTVTFTCTLKSNGAFTPNA